MNGWLEKLSRMTTGAVALRGVVFTATWTGLWVAVPAGSATPQFAMFAVAVALVGAFAPGSRVIDAIMLGIVAAWAYATLGLGEPAEPMRTFATAAALYMVHSAAAMAAVLPYDAVVDGQVLLRWAARCALVLAVAGLVTMVVVVLAPSLTPSTSAIALLLGLAAVAATVALLARGGRGARDA